MTDFEKIKITQRNNFVGDLISCLTSINIYVSQGDINYMSALIGLFDICDAGGHNIINNKCVWGCHKYIFDELERKSEEIRGKTASYNAHREYTASILESLLGRGQGGLQATSLIERRGPAEDEASALISALHINIIGGQSFEAYQIYNAIKARKEDFDDTSKLPRYPRSPREWEIYVQIKNVLELLCKEEESRIELLRVQLMYHTQMFRILKGL